MLSSKKHIYFSYVFLIDVFLLCIVIIYKLTTIYVSQSLYCLAGTMKLPTNKTQ